MEDKDMKRLLEELRQQVDIKLTELNDWCNTFQVPSEMLILELLDSAMHFLKDVFRARSEGEGHEPEPE